MVARMGNALLYFVYGKLKKKKIEIRCQIMENIAIGVRTPEVYKQNIETMWKLLACILLNSVI